ncbi:hypothetical protein ATE71_21370 [Sphingopyxis sp. H115]|nr:hypothetical protein ATE71_21370 [Sphingopyxis sp. H115]
MRAKAGIDYASLGNNHVHDYIEPGLAAASSAGRARSTELGCRDGRDACAQELLPFTERAPLCAGRANQIRKPVELEALVQEQPKGSNRTTALETAPHRRFGTNSVSGGGWQPLRVDIDTRCWGKAAATPCFSMIRPS